MIEIPAIQIVGEPGPHLNITDKEKVIQIPENRFYIPTHIEEGNLEEIVKAFRKLEHEKPEAEVLVEVNTMGGDIGAATELALVMHNSSLRVSTLVTNKAYSAGIVIAAAGDVGQRFAYPESDFLIHPSTYKINENLTLKQLDELREKKARAEGRYTSLLAAVTGNSQERIVELFNGDNYMNAQDAQAFGIIDHIVPQLKSLK